MFIYNLIIIGLSLFITLYYTCCIKNSESKAIPCSLEGISCQNISCCYNLVCYENTACINNNSK